MVESLHLGMFSRNFASVFSSLASGQPPKLQHFITLLSIYKEIYHMKRTVHAFYVITFEAIFIGGTRIYGHFIGLCKLPKYAVTS